MKQGLERLIRPRQRLFFVRTLLGGVYSEEDIPVVIEKVMLWYKENGYVKERLGAAIDRLGTDALEKALETNGLIDRKEEILAAPLLQR